MAKIINSTNKNTNLFYQMYSTSNDLTLSGFVCSSAIDEADTSFDISGNEAEITDSNGDTLASIDLTPIHADELSEYYTETKIIQPQSAYLLQGNVTGDTYAAQFFEIVPEIFTKEYYESFINLKFDIHYTNCGELVAINIDTAKLRKEPGSVCDILQEKFNSLKLPVSVTIKTLPSCNCVHNDCTIPEADFIVFQSTEEGYSFYVHSLFVSAVDVAYENADGSWVDYSESPFVGANITFDYIIDLIKTKKPRLIGESSAEYDYSQAPCDLYKFLRTILPMITGDHKSFAYNYSRLKEFAKCFDEFGNCIDLQKFVFVSNMYNDIYAYYWGHDYALMNRYNIFDIIDLLDSASQYVYKSNVMGPYQLFEDVEKRIYNQKYPNGAFRGMVLIPDWSGIENGDVAALKLAHVSDYINIDEKVDVPKGWRVEGFVCNTCVDLYRKVRARVKINTLLQSEYEIYKECDCNVPLRKLVQSNESLATCVDDIWTYDMHDHVSSDDAWTNSPNYSDGDDVWSDYVDEKNVHKTHKEHHECNHNSWDSDYVNEYRTPSKYEFMNDVPGHHCYDKNYGKEDVVGLYRYMQYLNENELWMKVGQAYMIVGAKDDYQSKVKNLQNSVLIYNPNNYPVRVKFMVFS